MRHLPFLLAGLACAFLSSLQAQDAELRGTVTDVDSGATIPGVTVTLTPDDASSPLSATTGVFGGFSFSAIPPGDYTLAASFPGYAPFSEARTFASTEIATRNIALSRVIPGAPLIDLNFVVDETSSGIAVKSVPIRVRRFSLADPAILEETLLVSTGSDGTAELRSQPPGYYDFRFNDPSDNFLSITANPIFDPMTIVTKAKLETSHLVRAQLLSTRAEVTVTAIGPDPATPGEGDKALPDVILELIGIDPDFTPPPGFDPFTDDPTDLTPVLFQRKMGATGAGGTFTFKDLPPLQFAVRAKKLGYESPWTVFGPTGPGGMLPSTHTQPLTLNPATKLEVFLDIPPYPELKAIPGLGIEVELEGMSGPVGEGGAELKTATSGIKRPGIASFFTSPEFPDGILRAEFTELVPGNYTVSVDFKVLTPDYPAFEDALSPVEIQLRGEARVDLAYGRTNGLLLELFPVPATITGRFFKAEDRNMVDRIAGREPPPLDRWAGPAYELAEQTGIEFTESELAPLLEPGLKIASVDTDENGFFTITVLPGVYGIKIPSLDGYWGSNYRSFNRTRDEAFALGWPYATTMAGIPAHPFGSLGIAINSGDAIDLDLFVRKQLYFLDGTVMADTDSPAIDQVAFGPIVASPIFVSHSHLAITGSVEFDENDSAPPAPITRSLDPGFSATPEGVKTLNAGASFLFKTGPGSHKITVSDLHHVFPTGVFEVVTLPDYGYVGEGVPGDGIIPMEDNWGQLDAAYDVIDPWVADYTGTHSLLITFKNSEGDVVRTESNPNYVKHPLMDDKLFEIGPTPAYTMTAGSHTIYVLHDGLWYSATFTIPDIPGPATKSVEFIVGTGTPVPPMTDYDLRVRAINQSNPTQAIPGITVTMADGVAFTLDGSGEAGADDHTGSYVPTSISGTDKWLPADGSVSSSYTDAITFKPDGTPVITVTVLLKRGMKIEGIVEATAEVDAASFTGPLGEGLEVRILNSDGSQVLARLTTDEEGAFSTGDTPLEFAETFFVETGSLGYQPYRKRFTPVGAADATDGPEYDFNLDIDLVPFEKPEIKLRDETFGFRGMFLVGVSKGKSLDGLLTRYGDDTDRFMPYTVRVEKPFSEFIEDFPAYDTASGGTGAVEDIQILDRVLRIWVIDPRAFIGPPNVTEPVDLLSADAGALQLPSRTITSGDNAGKPDPQFNEKMTEWIAAVVGARAGGAPDAPKIFWITADFKGFPDSIGSGEDVTSRHEISGDIDIALLPPGPFQPIIVARTQNGAFDYAQWSVAAVEDPYLKHRELFGVQLPPSLSKLVVDAAGSLLDYNVSGISAPVPAPLFTEKFFPSSALKLDGDVDGDIEVNTDKTLKYSYSYAVQIKEGADFPRSPGTLLAFGPKELAGNVSGSLLVTADGSRFDLPGSEEDFGVPALSLSGAGSAGRDFEKLFPTGSPFNISSGLSLGASLTSTKPLAFSVNGEVKPLHLLYSSKFRIGGFIQATMDFSDLIPAVRALKTFTSALGTDPKIEATLRPSLSFFVSRKWKTRSPAELFDEPAEKLVPDPGGSVDVVPKRESVENDTPEGKANRDEKILARQLRMLSAELCEKYPEEGASGLGVGLGFTGGLFVGIKGDLAEIGVEGEIVTENGSNPNVRFWDLTVNPGFDEPFFTDLSGKLSFEATARARAFFFEGRKKFDFGKIDVSRSFNTEPFFSLSPILITETSVGIATAPRAVLLGMEPHLVGDAFPIARYGTASGSGTQAVAFLDPDSSSGTMKLQFALQSAPPTWAAAVEIASAPGIVGVAIHPLSGGGWMAVWSEVSSAGISALSPATTLKFSTTLDGITWTPPSTIGSTPGTAFDLRLVPMPGGTLGLIYLETERGPGAEILDLEAFLYSGSTWGTQQVLFDDIFLTAFDAAGPGFSGTAEAQILGITDVGGLVAAGWNGTTLSATIGLDGSVTGAEAALTGGPDDTFTAAALLPDGTLGLFRKVGAGAWSALPPVALPGAILDLDFASVSDGVSTHYLAAYVDRAATRDPGFLYVDATGTLLTGPSTIAPDSPGYYSEVQILPVTGALAADVVALYRDGDDVSELRTFATSATAGVLPVDREPDLMDDLAELFIVDFDPTDGFEKVDDILPGDDFDGDTHANKVEVDTPTDATDPTHFPGQSVSVEALVDSTREIDPDPAIFRITRTGDTSVPLTVPFTLGGTATEGADYEAVTAATLTIPAGATEVFQDIFAVADGEAEGAETVLLTLGTDPAYTLGTATDSITLLDSPFDKYRFDNFTPIELSNPAIGGEDGDGEGDGTEVILEYAFDGDLFLSDPENLPVVGIVDDEVTDDQYLAIGYLRRKDDLELIYQVQISETLTEWRDATDLEMVQHSLTDNGDGTETVIVRDREPVTETVERFLRLNVSVRR